jgi:hypothetical protein
MNLINQSGTKGIPTMKKQFRVKRLAGALAVLLATAPVYSQNTAANLAGRITSTDGAPLVGAQVTIVHTPSGTTSRATTDAEGRYTARGLRVGGPYTVTVQKDGFQGEASENVFLLLGETSSVNVDLDPAATTELEAVEVVAATQSAIFSPDNMGTGSNVTREQIDSFPSINRNLQDYVRLDPRVAQTDKARNEISVGGQNSRYNAIRVDGIGTSDTFGLESNSLPTPKQPFSLDVIEEISVNVANYDVTISGATGGVINAVTKSGTNEFHGSVYGTYRENKWVRDNENGTDFAGFEDEWTAGLTFGGPLIKDTLFFFLNYEKYELAAPGSAFGPVGSGASNIVNITAAQIAEVQAIARNQYGFEPGEIDPPQTLETTAEDYSAKLDWNVNEDHRASFRYAKSEQSQANLVGFNATSLALSTFPYQRDFGFETYVGQLFSDWTDNFSTEAKISYRDYSAVRTPVADLPQIQVRFGTLNLNFGTEENTHANILETETWNAFFAGNYYMGDHDLKFGFDYEKNDIYNLFGRRINGVYQFNSVADFAAGRSARYQLFAPRDGNLDNMAAVWGIENLGLFIQDNWSVNYNLSLLFGLRIDTPMIDDEPTYNAAAETAFGFDNSQTIDGNDLIQPRFGFNYTFDWERPTQVRGGIGLFQGASANVWLSNPFTNTGFGYTDFLRTAGITSFDPDRQDQLGLIPGGATGGSQAVDFVDPDLGQPAVWKANLAFDHELPFWGLVGSAEVIVTSVEEAIFYQQLNLGSATRQGPDGRVMYWNTSGYNPACWNNLGNNVTCSTGSVRSRTNALSAFTDAIIARPTNKGDGRQLSLSLQKPYGEGNFFWQLGYTFTDAEEVSPLTSSTSGSQFGNNAVFQINEEVASRSSYAIRNRFTAAASYRHFFFDDLKTEVSAFYEGRSGKPFSYVFDNDANGDGRFGNDLLYIPAARGDVLFGSAAEENAFWAFVETDEYLRSHLGTIAERNGARSKWTNSVDLRISQELPGFFADNKAEIWLDILNVGNLIDKDWGQIDEIPFPLTRGVVEYGGIDAASGRYVYRFNTPDPSTIYDDRGVSRWAVQVGFRYQF